MKRKQQKFIKLSQTKRKILLAAAICMTFSMGSLQAAKPVPGGSTTCTITTTPDPAVVIAGGSIDFSGDVAGRNPKTYEWTFGGGSPATATTAAITVSYAVAGDYSAILNGVNGKGETCTATTSITVFAGGGNAAPVATDDSYSTASGEQLAIAAPGVLGNDTDLDGDAITAVLNSGTVQNGSSVSLNSDGSFTYTPANNFTGQDSFTYTATDGTDSSAVATVTIDVQDNNTAAFSINSTSRSQAAPASSKVTEQPFTTNSLYQVLAINDLGMHCGDLDTRISSILPPFNVLHSQVVLRGTATTKPRVLNQGEAQLYYSAISSPDDPITSISPVLAQDGSLYKTNFWDVARQAYGPFYPSGILDAFYAEGADIVDVGLPVPDVERLYLEDGNLHAGQQAMPGLNGPLVSNERQLFEEHIGTLPFFTAFAFGYTSNVNWSEAAGIPVAVYDDSGRKNPYPLMRVQADVDGTTVATVDTVVPISGEAECQRCHAEQAFDGGNGSATQALIEAGIEVTVSVDDPSNNVPLEASVEWASDINILKLHDLRHPMPDGEELYQGVDANTGTAINPVVCQVCHYTPALDLAQLGPLGPENDGPLVLNGVTVATSMANGRDQVKNKSMSNVMHSFHGQFTNLFPDMPAAVNAQGEKRDPAITKQVLNETCYACHPGTKTECMRGAMANGGQVCQDCHGDMLQVGDDFTRDVSPANPGAFHIAADFYNNPNTPRVPWANEPGCGSCHTGSATANLTAQNNTLVNPVDSAGNVDGIRLAQAYRTDDSKATPIVPTNKMFAENVVEPGEGAAAAVGNPKLYRVSVGHGDLFCEACHGATHAEWPNAIPFANDNVASLQMQGHTGTVTECLTCHEATDDSLPLGNSGPHGMHPIADFTPRGPNSVVDTRWNFKHRNFRNQGPGCESCHGTDLAGTVLSRAATDRKVQCKDTKGSLDCVAEADGNLYATISKGTPVGCGLCHQQKR